MTDMTGRRVREPGKAGERYREVRERRARPSRANKEKLWAWRMENASTPLRVFQVSADRLTAAVTQRERAAVVARDRAAGRQPGSRQETAARTRLDRVRKEITADLLWLSERMLEIAERHETHRI